MYARANFGVVTPGASDAKTFFPRSYNAMVLHMWVPGLALPAHPALVHASAQRSAMQPDAALQRRLGSHATLAQAPQDGLTLVPTAGAAKRKVGNQLRRNECGAFC